MHKKCKSQGRQSREMQKLKNAKAKTCMRNDCKAKKMKKLTNAKAKKCIRSANFKNCKAEKCKS